MAISGETPHYVNVLIYYNGKKIAAATATLSTGTGPGSVGRIGGAGG
jgi:hypothetical protein